MVVLCIGTAIGLPKLAAQITPANRSTLNYRLIGFSVPAQKDVDAYEFVVNEYIITDSGTTIEKTVLKEKAKDNVLITTVPKFATTYTWKVNYYTKETLSGSSELYRFATGYSPFTDTSKYRLRVLKNSLKGKQLYIFIDGTRTLFDTDGNPLWYIPNIDGLVDENSNIRDLKISPQGTITFLCVDKAIEIDYQGNVLWVAPNDGKVSGEKTEYYHHEFSKTSKNTYMVAGAKITSHAIPNNIDLSKINAEQIDTIKRKHYIKVPSGTLIEYDKDSNVIWSWNSSKHIPEEELFHQNSDGNYTLSTHLNAFYFNEREKHIYLSFRNTNKIYKINYPEGNVIARYGPDKSNNNGTEKSYFYGQHSCKLDKKGNIYLYNNNQTYDSRNSATNINNSNICVFKEVNEGADSIIKIWEFECDIDSFAKPYTKGGGGVIELNDESFLVCMSGSNRNFIVRRNKEILWNIITEKKYDNIWKPLNEGYRSSAVEGNGLLHQLLLPESAKYLQNH